LDAIITSLSISTAFSAPSLYRKRELQAWPAFKPNHSDFCLLLFLAGVLDGDRCDAKDIRLAMLS
jgi:hypothetical protein